MPEEFAASARADWRRSTRCVGESHCVEVADLGSDQVGLRNSQIPGVSLTLSVDQWRGLVSEIKAGSLRP